MAGRERPCTKELTKVIISSEKSRDIGRKKRMRGPSRMPLCGSRLAAIFVAFFVSASFLTIKPHSENSSANSPMPLTDETAVRALDSALADSTNTGILRTDIMAARALAGGP